MVHNDQILHSTKGASMVYYSCYQPGNEIADKARDMHRDEKIEQTAMVKGWILLF